MDWIVTVTAKGTEMEVISDSQLEELAATFETSASVSASRGAFSVPIICAAGTVEEAIAGAVESFRKASVKLGIPEALIVGVEALTVDEIDAELDKATIPELAGVAEIAGFLGVSKQRASELARYGNFPRPVAELASGPVWIADQVRAYEDRWERKPGRPPKSVFDVLIDGAGEAYGVELKAGQLVRAARFGMPFLELVSTHLHPGVEPSPDIGEIRVHFSESLVASAADLVERESFESAASLADTLAKVADTWMLSELGLDELGDHEGTREWLLAVSRVITDNGNRTSFEELLDSFGYTREDLEAVGD